MRLPYYVLFAVLVGIAGFLLGRHTAPRDLEVVDPTLRVRGEVQEEGHGPTLHGSDSGSTLTESSNSNEEQDRIDADDSTAEAAGEVVADEDPSRRERPEDPRRALEVALDSIDRLSWGRFNEVLPFVARSDLPSIDARLIEASRRNDITPWNVEQKVLPYLRTTGRTTWTDIEPFVRDGMAVGDGLQMATFVVLALRAEPPPEPNWFDWVVDRYNMPEKVVLRVRDHLRAARKSR